MKIQSFKYIERSLQKNMFSIFILFFDFRSFGIEYRSPQTDEELAEMFKLRYRVYCEEYKFLKAEDFPDRLEKDADDDHSEYILALSRDNEIIGCVRLIKPNNRPFPTEHSFKIKIKDRRDTVEVSRLIVEKRFRSTKVGIGLYRGIYRRCVELGYINILEAMEKEVAKWINYLFLRFMPISEPQSYYGTMNRAFIANVFDISKAVKKDNIFLYLYLNWKLPHNNVQRHAS